MDTGNNGLSAWEKMQRDMIYDDFDEDLFHRRVAAKTIFKQYNKTTDEQVEERRRLMESLFGRVGSNVYVEPDFTCEFGKNIFIGDNVYINFGAVLLDCSRITIGNNVLIGPNVGMYSANHSLDPEERAQGALIGGRITIGDKAWIAGDVKIMAGVTIGEGAVIGCGSIVTHDIPPRTLAAGNPCRVIRPITEADKVGFVK
ncbi:MAG: sugar O-acetyltransferase [Akkermansia sp.]|nr:sugar O-acetyltransferase [Akkermansia sp.]